jgi:hypothetical protein
LTRQPYRIIIIPLIIYVWSCEQYSLDTLYFYDLHSLLSQNFLEAFVVN